MVRRCDFWEAFTDNRTKDVQATITRAKLHQRFRSSAAEMTLEEFIGRAWPAATDADRKMMKHWARLHDASLILLSSSFRGTPESMEQIFDLLDPEGSEMFSLSELVRAGILTKDESHKLLQDWQEKFGWERSAPGSEFRAMMEKQLVDKYASEVWHSPCRSAFLVSKEKVGVRPGIKMSKVLSRRKTLDQDSLAMAC